MKATWHSDYELRWRWRTFRKELGRWCYALTPRVVKCEVCGGFGTVRIPHGFYQIASKCKACDGEGSLYPPTYMKHWWEWIE